MDAPESSRLSYLRGEMGTALVGRHFITWPPPTRLKSEVLRNLSVGSLPGATADGYFTGHVGAPNASRGFPA